MTSWLLPMIVGGAVEEMTIERCPWRHQREMDWVEWLQESQWYAMKLVLGNIMNVPVIDTRLYISHAFKHA